MIILRIFDRGGWFKSLCDRLQGQSHQPMLCYPQGRVCSAGVSDISACMEVGVTRQLKQFFNKKIWGSSNFESSAPKKDHNSCGGGGWAGTLVQEAGPRDQPLGPRDLSHPTVSGTVQVSTCCWTTTPGRTRPSCETPLSGPASGRAWCAPPHARRGHLLPHLCPSTSAESPAVACCRSLPACDMFRTCMSRNPQIRFSIRQNTTDGQSVSILKSSMHTCS